MTTPATAPTTSAVDPDAELMALLATAEGRAHPYPHYARIREDAPVFRSGIGSWIVSRFAHCQQVLRSPHFGKGADQEATARVRIARWGIPPEEAAEFFEFFEGRQSMLTLNPPDHTRPRGLVARAFTPNTVEALRPHVEVLCDGLLDTLADLAAAGAMVDVMRELVFLFLWRSSVSCSGSRWRTGRSSNPWSGAATVILEPTSTLDDLRGARAARITMERYFEELIAERRRRPADDLLTELIAVSDGSDRLSQNEVIATAVLLFAAGFETTTNLIGNGLWALVCHPEQFELMRSSVGDPGAMQRAVEELLRWDSPVQLDGRAVLRDTEVAGQALAAGDQVMTLLGAADRDPRRFTSPETLDLRRDEGQPMSFGSGIHYCLGAALARVEGQVCSRPPAHPLHAGGAGRGRDRAPGLDHVRAG